MNQSKSMCRSRIMQWVMLGTLGLATPLMATEAEMKAALDVLPAGAPLALVVPNMKGLSEKVAALGLAMGVQSPEMANLLGKMKDESGMKGGVRENGPLVVALADTRMLVKAADQAKAKVEGAPGAVTNDMNDKEPPVLVFFPVTIPNDFYRNFANVKEEDGLTVGMDKDGDTHYMKAMDGYVVTAQVKEVLQKYVPGKAGAQWLQNAGAKMHKSLSEADVAVLADVQAMSEPLQTLVAQGAQKMKDELEEAADAGRADMMSLVFGKLFVQSYGDISKALARDASFAVATGDLSGKNVGLSYGIQFKPGSPTAGYFKAHTGDAGLMAKLPTQNYLMAGGVSLAGMNVKSLVAEAMGALKAEEKELGDMGQVIMTMLPMYEDITGIGFAMYIPAQVQMGSPLFNTVTFTQTTNPAGYRERAKTIMAKMNNMKIPFNVPGGGKSGEAITYTTSFTPDATKVEGVPVDQFSVQVQYPPSAMQGNPMMPMMNMLGANGQTGYMAQVDNYVLTTSTQDLPMLTEAIKSLRAANGLGTSKLIEAARQQGVADATAEGYVSFTGLASIVNTFGMMFGMPPIQVPADLPPVSLSYQVGPDGMVSRLNVPVDNILFVKDTVQQLQAGPPGGRGQGGQGSAPSRRRRGGNNNPPPAF